MGDADEIRRAIDELDAGFVLASAVPDDDPAWGDLDVAVTPQQRVASLAGLLTGVRRIYEAEVRPAALAYARMLDSTDFDAVARSIADLDAIVRRLADVTSALDARDAEREYTWPELMTLDPSQLSETEWRGLVGQLAFDLALSWTWGRP